MWSALDAWWNLAGIASGGMLGLFLLGFLSRRASSTAASWVGTVRALFGVNPLDDLSPADLWSSC